MKAGNTVALAVVLAGTLLAGCNYTPTFGFPAQEGDADAGLQAFIDHRCHQCHSVADMRMPELAGASAPILELGGATSSVQSYAGLMTSVINPDHAISERYREQQLLRGQLPLNSPMPTPRLDNMTVRQLIDIVAFLDSKYVLLDTYFTE